MELSGIDLTLQQWCITHSDMYHLDAMGHTGFSRRISAPAIASLDIDDTTGRLMNMTWRIDKKAGDRDYQWQAWP